MFDILDIGLLAFGALLAGFVNGLTGFGTAMAALAFWLFVVPPVVAAPLVAICAVGAHALSVPRIYHTFDFRAALPYLIGGFLGVPLGMVLLWEVSPDLFKGLIGLFLAVYALVMLMLNTPPTIKWGGRFVDSAIGFISGVLGGFAGLSGPIPALWCLLRGWSKERQRSVNQGFNMLILAFVVIMFAANGLMTRDVGTAALICLPATFLGSWFGSSVFLKINPDHFRRVVLAIVGLSGVLLSASWLLG